VTADEIEKRAKALFEKNAKGWNGAPPWEELHEDTRELWRNELRKRESAAPRSQDG
jgi:hypothetical protein